MKHKLPPGESVIADYGYIIDPKVMSHDEYSRDKSNHVLKAIGKFPVCHKTINVCFKNWIFKGKCSVVVMENMLM